MMERLFGFVLLSIAISCSKKADTNRQLSQPSDSTIVHSKLMLDKKIWMTENLDINIPDSYCRLDDTLYTLYCNKYGRLYTWEAGVQGCNALGKGWRLPTNQEWQNMAKQYGGIYDDSDDKGKSAYLKLSERGSAEFNALLGGNRQPDGSYERLDAHGFYWTSTEYDSAEAWFYNFGKESTLLNHHTGSKKRSLSVRCIYETNQ
jgi:uncharacterized protein (TIGR02145 family)